MKMLNDLRNVAMILFLLIASYGVYAYVDIYEDNVDPGSYRSFSVSAEGEATAVSDVARFSFSVVTEGDEDLASIQAENTEKMNNIIDYLKKSGVDEKDIKTSNYNLNPRYQYYGCEDGVCPPSEIVGYTIRQTVGAKMRDFDKAGEILVGVVEYGANDISGPSFTIDDPTEVENEARKDAIKKAREKAELIAEAGSFKVGDLVSIYEDEYYERPMYADMAYGMGGGVEKVSAPTIEAGSEDVTVNITLTFEIE